MICTTSVVLHKLPKVNSHPIGEKSPNLVTLAAYVQWYRLCLLIHMYLGREIEPSHGFE
jgi:hypothetical protein